MKTQLRLAPHSRIDGEQVIEIWHDGEFIGQVTGADEAGVRVITKHQMEVAKLGVPVQGVSIVEVKIRVSPILIAS